MNNQVEYVYGIHATSALLKNHPKKIIRLYLAREKRDQNLQEILQIAKDHAVQVKVISSQEINSLLPKVTHQGIAAEISRHEVKTYIESDLESLLENNKNPPFLLILDSIQDPHNLGACLRSANAAGIDAVIAPKDRAVGLTPIVRKVARVAAEITPFIQVTNLARTMVMLKERGIWLYGAAADSDTSIYKADLKGAIALALGGEGQGLRRLTEEHCDFLISIPMFGSVSSLNVSVATGICLFEAVRQRTRSN